MLCYDILFFWFPTLSIGEGGSRSVPFQTLCGTPNRVENLRVVGVPGVPGQSLNVTWEQPTQLNGDPNSIQYVVRS